jgi:hypothetical protein
MVVFLVTLAGATLIAGRRERAAAEPSPLFAPEPAPLPPVVGEP